MLNNKIRKVVIKSGIVEQRFYIGDYEYYEKEEIKTETLKIQDDKQVVALINSPFEGGTGEVTVRYQLTNHLGSASLELNETGEIISYEEYHPFGTTSYRSGRSEVEVSLKCYKYVFKELDNETGLYYYGMRYYASWIARFISVDPLQFKYPHYTPFQYAGNKPISYIDLDGAEEAETNYASPVLKAYYEDKKQQNPFARFENKIYNNVAGDRNNSSIGMPKYNAEYLKKTTKRAIVDEKIAKNHRDGQAASPFVYGGGDLGFGFANTTATALKEAPFVILPEMALARLAIIRKIRYANNTINAKSIFNNFSKIETHSATYSFKAGKNAVPIKVNTQKSSLETIYKYTVQGGDNIAEFYVSSNGSAYGRISLEGLGIEKRGGLGRAVFDDFMGQVDQFGSQWTTNAKYADNNIAFFKALGAKYKNMPLHKIPPEVVQKAAFETATGRMLKHFEFKNFSLTYGATRNNVLGLFTK